VSSDAGGDRGIVPWFDAGPAPEGARPLLLVSYHFPPSEAAGALRWQKLAAFAAERGYRLDVLALDPAGLARSDPARLGDLPSGTRIFAIPDPPLLRERAEEMASAAVAGLRGLRPSGGTEIPAPEGPAPSEASAEAGGDGHSLGRDVLGWHPLDPAWLRRAYFAASAYAREGAWARRATKLGRALCRRTSYATVLTCGPPHMVHEVGRRLARSRRLPFVMDMRDPWSLQPRLPEHLASPLWYALARRHEGRAVAEATVVACNTVPAAEALREAHPEAAGRILAVMNGFDEVSIRDCGPRDRFLITFAGTLYLDRDPTALFRAAGRLVQELRLEPAELGLEFIGHVERFGGVPLERIADEAGLDPAFLTTRAFMTRDRLTRHLAGSAVLVNLPQDSDLSIPSKVFEYLCFPAWLLAMESPDTATGRLLRDSGADLVDPGDVEAIEAAVKKRYLAFRSGERPAPLARGLPQLSRRAQAEKLLDALEAAINRSGGRRA